VDVNTHSETALKEDSPTEIMPGPLSSADAALADDPSVWRQLHFPANLIVAGHQFRDLLR